MRRDLYGTDKNWVSVKPKKYEYIITLSPIEQVVYQVKEINNYIETTINKKDIKNVICIDYEAMCEKPSIVIENIKKTYTKSCGIQIKSKNNNKIKLGASNKKTLTNKEWNILSDAVKRIYG